jgi:hypothetical protein
MDDTTTFKAEQSRPTEAGLDHEARRFVGFVGFFFCTDFYFGIATFEPIAAFDKNADPMGIGNGIA